MWGQIDIDEYEHYDSPLNGDLHEVVPGKFVAFKGPKGLEEEECYKDAESGFREFSAKYYAEIFLDFKVELVIRLNEPEYNEEVFADHGMQHLDLHFEDCTVPCPRVVDEFLRAAESFGVVAVHCKAGLGRTGTLIALYMMRHYGFTGREAMGWLRIMRPGSVIGEQQQFLCRDEGAGRTDNDPGRAAALAAQVSAGMERRGSFRVSLCAADRAGQDSARHSSSGDSD